MVAQGVPDQFGIFHLATGASWARQGTKAKVLISGLAIMSLSSIRAKPSMEEPSKPMPSNPVSSSDGVMAKLFRTPRTSVNQNWMKLTFFSRTTLSRSYSVRISMTSSLGEG